jgi:predicted DsbA family dithiol-disulfide isomerase
MSLCLLLSSWSYAAIEQGNPHGSVSMIEVFDYQCAHCHNDYTIVKQLEHENKDLRVRLMPVAIVNTLSIYEAAAAVVSAQYPGKFELFDHIAMGTHALNQIEIQKTLAQLGCNTPSFNQEMHSKSVEDQLNQGLIFLKNENSGTPLFIIYPSNDSNRVTVLSGEQSYHALQEAIDHVS